VRSRITHETATFELAALHLGETELTGGVRVSRPHSDYGEVSDALAAAMEPGGIPTVIRLLDEHFRETPLSIRSLSATSSAAFSTSSSKRRCRKRSPHSASCTSATTR
jgi:hypothetical protein